MPDLPPATETVAARYRDIDSWPLGESLEAMWEAQAMAVAAVRTALPAIERAVEACVGRARGGGRLVYCGAGTSGRIGVQDGAELPPTFGWPEHRLLLLMAGGELAFTRAVENAEDDARAGEAAVETHGIGLADIVIGVAASGSTPYTTAIVRAAAGHGAMTIGVANSPGGALLAAAAHPILVETGAEVVAGSTRMKAGTAQKIVLNLFSTALMLRLGRVHQGLMVDMQARNEKLRGRAVRMLRMLTERGDEEIAAALFACDNRVKTAALVLEGVAPGEAEGLLARHDDSLRLALAELRG